MGENGKVKMMIGLLIAGLLHGGLVWANTLQDEAPEKSKKTFELGTEASWIKYEEPDVMEEEGVMGGLNASLSERWANHVVVQADGHINWGSVDYDSNGTGSIDNISDFLGEARVSAGYDFYVLEASRVTPYVGFGYRYLLDEIGGETSSTGALGYDRESNYFYVPIGFETQTAINDSWRLGFTLEYDLFISGKQKSHLEDAIAGLDTLENDQDEGWGARGSIRLTKVSDRFDFFLEPFVRYWNIAQSDTKSITYSGTPIGVVGYEPKNNSTQGGVKLGMQF
ncbi:MAG: hypothetical protein A2Z81_08360 [Omnitrophica WOR_2 bacterium GWA2_45_18]|nr:MAG: hypothetical protein A2Z81_08360 [Omnitrophica WOR_2 bacterium GWA2_45_18]